MHYPSGRLLRANSFPIASHRRAQDNSEDGTEAERQSFAATSISQILTISATARSSDTS